jgi:hypothetical protein
VANEAGSVEYVYGGTQANKCCLSTYNRTCRVISTYKNIPCMYWVHTSMNLNCQTHSENTMFLLLTMRKDTVCTGQVRGGV